MLSFDDITVVIFDARAGTGPQMNILKAAKSEDKACVLDAACESRACARRRSQVEKSYRSGKFYEVHVGAPTALHGKLYYTGSY